MAKKKTQRSTDSSHEANALGRVKKKKLTGEEKRQAQIAHSKVLDENFNLYHSEGESEKTRGS